jgi:hypothetical protein
MADKESALRTLSRVAALASAALTAVAVTATMVFLIATLRTRTLDYAEGEVLFDAARIRERLPVYFDVSRGALEYGPIPSRHFVVYVPTFAWLLAQLPASAAAPVGRLASLVVWTAALAWIAAGARRERRTAAIVGALFILGAETLTYHAALARPDGLAVALAGVALGLTVRRGRVGWAGGVLFAMAAWLKPNVIGAFTGAMLAEVIVHRTRAYAAVLGCCAVSVPVAFLLQRVSLGVWTTHLAGSTLAPLRSTLFFEHMASRLPFFGIPLLFAACAVWGDVRSPKVARGECGGGWHAFLALVASSTWTLIALAKVGSASNYWMEPCIAGLVAIAHASKPPPWGAPQAVLALAQCLWVDVASVRESVTGLAQAGAQYAVIMRVRDSCDGLVVADTPGLEMELNGRVLCSPFQLRYLAKAGGFSADQWVETLRRPEIACALTNAPLGDPLAPYEADAALPAVHDALVERFVLAEHTAGLWFYKARR